MSINIFLSVGRTFTQKQENFVQSIERCLQVNGLIPQTVGRNYIKNQQPLKSVKECMDECAGTVILAFERVYIQNGIEKRGSATPKTITDANLPTVWNQIEAAMAYVLGQPILVLVENGLKSEGLLETGYDWYVKWVNLDDSPLNDPEFNGIFADWKRHVEEFHSKRKKPTTADNPTIDVGGLTIGEIFKSLKPAQLWGMGVAIASLLSGIAYLAYSIGQKIK
ncbi:MAG: hypothetical protein WBV94_04900 [Blastocatellia bacterium]